MSNKLNEKFYHAIFISPHLDDAVFSCGAEIQKIAQKGKVLVINIFTLFLEEDKRSKVFLGEERYIEEKNAANYLNFESINLDFLDAFYRNDKYKKLANIFKQSSSSEAKLIHEVSEKLTSLLSQIDFDVIYLPLGVGWHIDHLVCHELRLNKLFADKIIFYEDMPYAQILPSLDLRFSQLVPMKANKHFIFMNSFLLARSFLACGMTSTIKPNILKCIIFPFIFIFFLKLLMIHKKNNSFDKKMTYVPKVSQNSEFFNRKVQAIKMYNSQLKVLFGSEEKVEETYQTYSKLILNNNKAVERFWSIDAEITKG